MGGFQEDEKEKRKKDGSRKVAQVHYVPVAKWHQYLFSANQYVDCVADPLFQTPRRAWHEEEVSMVKEAHTYGTDLQAMKDGAILQVMQKCAIL